MGLFISFEGPDGSGKSTQAARVAAEMRRLGSDITLAREPGGTPLGDRLRELILDPQSPSATPLVMAFMLSASRAQLVETIIRPALARGETVIVDRYADSTVAYQSFGLGVDLDTVSRLTEIATGGLIPDITVLVDVPDEVGVARLTARGGRNRLDSSELDFLRRVRTGYEYLMERDPARWIHIDGTGSPEEVQMRILNAITPVLRDRVGRT